MWYWYHFVGLTKLLEYDFRTRKPKPKTFRCRVVTHKVDTAVFSRFCSHIVMGNMLNCDFCLILPKILAILSLMMTEFTHTHTHTQPFNGPFPGLPRWAGTSKLKPVWILLKQQTTSGSGISWAICRSAPHSRLITTPAPHHSRFFTGRMLFLPPNQQRQSTEGWIQLHKMQLISALQYSILWLCLLS